MTAPGNWWPLAEELSPEMLAWLANEYGISANDTLDADAFTKGVSALDGARFAELDRFRDVVKILSDENDRSIDDALLVNPNVDLPDTLSAVERVVWLKRNHCRIVDEAVELHEYGRKYQKEAYWDGFLITDRFDLSKLKEEKDALEAAFSTCFQKPGRPKPKVKVRWFKRTSTRSDSRALHVLISVQGDPKWLREFPDDGPKRRTYNPERVASLVLDDKEGTVDVVTEGGGKTLRQGLAEVCLKTLGADFERAVKLEPRYVYLESLSSRRALPHAPEDGVETVRLVGVRLVKGRNGFISFDARGADADDAWAAWKNWFHGETESFGAVGIIGATLEFSFPDTKAPKGIKRRELKLNKPSGLTVRNWPDTHRQIADMLLKRWGLLSDTPHGVE